MEKNICLHQEYEAFCSQPVYSRLSEKSFVLFIQYPPETAASRPNIFYPEIHEVDLWQV